MVKNISATLVAIRLHVSDGEPGGHTHSTSPASHIGMAATTHAAKTFVSWAIQMLPGMKMMNNPIWTALVRASAFSSSSDSVTRPSVSTRARNRSLTPSANAILSISHKNRIAGSAFGNEHVSTQVTVLRCRARHSGSMMVSVLALFCIRLNPSSCELHMLHTYSVEAD